MKNGKMKNKILSLTKKDFDIQTFQSGGPGGQHQNKTDSGVRIVHKESGAVGESREYKSQRQNKKVAFERLTKSYKFKVWINKKTVENDIDSRVDELMKPQFIKTEYL